MGSYLFISLIFSTIGAGYFIYGKKEAEVFSMVAGIILCIYPYFITGLLPMIIVGLILMTIPFIANRFI